MKRLLMILSLLFVNNSISVNTIEFVVPHRIKFDKEQAIKQLKNEGLYLYRDIEKIDSLAFNTIFYSIEDSLIANAVLSKCQIATAIETLALFESAKIDKKGSAPFKSTLFIKSNNAFGIKGKGHKTYTNEFVKGKKIRIYSSFKYYYSFEENINDLIRLLVKRYKLNKVHSAKSLFWTMKRKGYYTAPETYTYALIRMFKQLDALHIKKNSYVNVQ